MARICVFDVNETLLDLGALDPYFQRCFGDRALRPAWFSQMLQLALVSTVTGEYETFGRLGMAALDMLAVRQGVQVTEENKQELQKEMKHLPPHPDVIDGLSMLRTAGVRLVTLTNSTAEVGEAQIANAGLRDYFEALFSADIVRRLKPAPEAYRMVAEQLGVQTSALRLIAAHAWDVAGALHAGCAAAFVARPGMVPSPLGAQPDIIGRDIREVARKILEHDR